MTAPWPGCTFILAIGEWPFTNPPRCGQPARYRLTDEGGDVGYSCVGHAAHVLTVHGATVEDLEAPRVECRCVVSCADDPPTACSLSGEPHIHPDDGSGTFGRCPAHPDAPGDW